MVGGPPSCTGLTGLVGDVWSSNAICCLMSPPFSQHAYALELLHDQLYEGAKALDVGSGSGILSVCFARMVSPSPWVQHKKTPECP